MFVRWNLVHCYITRRRTRLTSKCYAIILPFVSRAAIHSTRPGECVSPYCPGWFKHTLAVREVFKLSINRLTSARDTNFPRPELSARNYILFAATKYTLNPRWGWEDSSAKDRSSLASRGVGFLWMIHDFRGTAKGELLRQSQVWG